MFSMKNIDSYGLNDFFVVYRRLRHGKGCTNSFLLIPLEYNRGARLPCEKTRQHFVVLEMVFFLQ